MQTNNLLDFALDKIDDMKARDVITLDVRDTSNITDFMVVCSGNSKRQVQSIAQHLAKEAKEHDLEVIGMEGQDIGEWVLVDLGDVVVHVMQDETRDFYQLEKLWG
ncbi:ribosome silencing factor [Pseudoalteromonas sp. CNC9-20]|uniref:ribosome silencing factor n=1 Tax=Pseudoalteromonas sp. CNC9-20 TaxID=2917750 RepID=UPI001EF4D19E|nr:ribosome silencing factor [Pseudoalteromonas sp. CNC9-20]MCG7571081.1 ribosome silencing factor [Pseudoalteromonas sp. CNC9-20]